MQRLGRNHGGYHGERIDIRAVLREAATTASNHGWRCERFHHSGEFEWLALTRDVPTARPLPPKRVYISTGIHGDEPAGPLAAARLLRANHWPPDCSITVLPCLNPCGFELNSRANGQGIDLNRDYLHSKSAEVRAHLAWLEKQPPFDICFCLHEDWESHGFYVYELNPEHRPTQAESIIAGVAKVCPIDLSSVIEGREAAGGIIRPNLDPKSRPDWPEAFWLITHRTRLSYTLEAPSDFPLPTRVEALMAGVNSALACFSSAAASRV